MKSIYAAVVVLLAVFQFGCSNPIKEDLLQYINTDLVNVADYESTALEAYDSVTGDNYVSDYVLYTEVTETVIPNYRKLESGLEEITANLKTPEVRALNEKYIEAVNTQMNAFLLMANAIKVQDASKVIEFNERLDKGRRLLREWQIALQDLCKKNGVEFNPEASAALSSSAYDETEGVEGTYESGYTVLPYEDTFVYFDADKLNVRDAPDNGKVVAQLSQGNFVHVIGVTEEKVTIGGREDRWVKIDKANDKELNGWVFGGFLGAERGGPKYRGIDPDDEWFEE